MIKVLIYKELKNILLKFQFQFITIVAIVICISFVLLGIMDFKLQMEDYDVVSLKNKINIENINVFSELKPLLAKKPNVLSIFCKGDTHNSLNYLQVTPFDTKDDFEEGISSNPYINEMFSFDFTKIISILLSLLALLLSYSAISEEHEKGTLKILLSNNLPRWKILGVKILSYQISVTISLLIVFIGSIIIILFSKAVDLNIDMLSRLVIIFIYFELYLLIFVLIGCLCSIIFRRSSISLLIGLFFWLIMIVIVPTGAYFVAGSLSDNSSESDLNKHIDEITTETYTKINEWRSNHPAPGKKYSFGYIQFSEEKHEFITRGVREEFINWCVDYFTYRNNLYLENNRRIYAYYSQAERKKEKRHILENNIACFSLSKMLESAIENYTSTSFHDFILFKNYVKLYRESLIEYLKSKNGFSSRRWFTDDPPGSDPIVTDVENYDVASLVNDKKVQYKIYMAANVSKNEYNRKLNLKDTPVFIHTTTSINESFTNSFKTTLIFLLMIGILIYAVFVSFNNYALQK